MSVVCTTSLRSTGSRVVVGGCAKLRIAPTIFETRSSGYWITLGSRKDGKRSPGVKRQYSGTVGKIGNCQIGVWVHAVGRKGTVPLGWALYLPQDWCTQPERRRRAKIPAEVEFKTKPELGVELIERAEGWEITPAPVMGDCAYGDKTELRARLHNAGRE
jgi:SRSO17 transposase